MANEKQSASGTYAQTNYDYKLNRQFILLVRRKPGLPGQSLIPPSEGGRDNRLTGGGKIFLVYIANSCYNLTYYPQKNKAIRFTAAAAARLSFLRACRIALICRRMPRPLWLFHLPELAAQASILKFGLPGVQLTVIAMLSGLQFMAERFIVLPVMALQAAPAATGPGSRWQILRISPDGPMPLPTLFGKFLPPGAKHKSVIYLHQNAERVKDQGG